MSLAEQMAHDVGTTPAQSTQSQPAQSLANRMAQDVSAKPVAEPRKLGPVGSVLDAAGGVAETLANGALGTAGALGGGLANVAGLALTRDPERAKKWHDWAQRNISTVAGLYDPTPETETGKGIQDAFTSAVDAVKQGTGKAGDVVLAATGSPGLATAVDVGGQAAAQIAAGVAGAGAARYVRRGIPGNSEAVQSTVDQGRGKEPQPVSSEGLARQVSGGGAANASTNPYPTLTGQQLVRGGDFPQIKLSQTAGDLPKGEQVVRSAVAGKILGEGGQRIRPGVVTGNEDTLRTEAALAKAANPTPQGLILRDKIAEEQRALANFADNIVNSTGASQTLLNNSMRGDLLNSALYGPESLRAYLHDAKGQIYAEAAQRQGPNPVALPSLEKMVSSPQLASSLKIAGIPNMLGGVHELLGQFKTNGFENPVTGESIAPNSVGAAMELHKALNSAWSPENSQYIGRMKKAILDDVAQAGGADLYQQANAIHAAERTLMDAPGIKRIFGDVDPNTGIAKGLSPEKILPTLNSLPLDQYAHVYNVFSDMARGKVPGSEDLRLPSGLQDAAQQALREMSGSLVRDIQSAGADKAGVWNANSANKVLNSYTEKLKLVAPPDVLRDLHTLNVGGQIMPGMHAYEGAAQQARRLDQAGLIEQNLPRIGAVAGGLTRIPGAEWLGGKAGEAVQARTAAKRQMRMADQTDTEMESAAKVGATLKDIIK